MEHFKIAILGAGVSGISAAIYLQRRGIGPFRLFEKASDVGGTWRDNVYPGVECDIPSHLYSYSFALKPDWSQEFAPGAEIHEYLRDVAKKWELFEQISFNTEVEFGAFTDDRWHLRTKCGREFTADYVISALGGLHVPKIPDIPGLSDFPGKHFHTARWDKDADLADKRIAVIGTGATTVQVAPELAKVARELNVFQRSPIWVGPKRNRRFALEDIDEMRRNPAALRKRRWDLWKGWETIGYDLVVEGSQVNRASQQAAVHHLEAQVRSPELRARLLPGYNYTCKRPTISNTYYPMFELDNVKLVTSGIDRIDGDSIITLDGLSHQVDIIVFATGFKSFNISNEIDFRGEGGVALSDVWRDRILNYKSVLVPQMPNLFMLAGPNSAGLTSAFQMIEAASNYVCDLIQHMDENNHRTVVPRLESVEEFREHIVKSFSKTTQNKGCTSWWTDGGDYPHTSWPGSSISYRAMLQYFEPRALEFG